MRPLIFKNPSKRNLTRLIKLRSYFRKFHSLNKLDETLSVLLPHKNGYYVEIGANDGISQSNSLYFERKKNWSGILVEPDKYNFRILTRNRKKRNITTFTSSDSYFPSHNLLTQSEMSNFQVSYRLIPPVLSQVSALP